jgi:RNA polymerase nonessential primary-like sigma factor
MSNKSLEVLDLADYIDDFEDDSSDGQPLSDTSARDMDEGELDATRLYLNEIGFSPLLSAEEEVYYARLAQRGDKSGRQRMIESNLRLVVKVASAT